jgi:3-oxoacyl-[acyl-carrier-protein] synthase II
VSNAIRITGAGVVSPFGPSADALREALLAGRTAIAADPAADGCRSTLAARVRDFDPAAWIAPMKLRRMDTTGPLAVVMARQAMAQARVAPAETGDDRIGVVLGTWSAGGQATTEYLDALFAGGPPGAPALLFNSTVGNAAAGLVGLEWKLRGPNATISHKEASGLAAIAAAAALLEQQRCDAAVAGGVDAIYPLFYQTHDTFRVMSAATSAGECTAPFSVGRGGFVLGEGAYGVWMERGDGWRERGATLLGTLLATAGGAAPAALNAWPASSEAIVRVLQQAIDAAGLTPGDVDVVYASANAAPGLDAVELAALGALFGGSRTAITAVKGSLGESGAAGAASLVAALLCGVDGRVPPVAGLTRPDPAAAGLRVVLEAQDAPGPVSLVLSIASGGAVECAVVEAAAAQAEPNPSVGPGAS